MILRFITSLIIYILIRLGGLFYFLCLMLTFNFPLKEDIKEFFSLKYIYDDGFYKYYYKNLLVFTLRPNDYYRKEGSFDAKRRE